MILGAYIVNLFRRVGFELQGNVARYKGEIEGKRNHNQGDCSPYYLHHLSEPSLGFLQLLSLRRDGPGELGSLLVEHGERVCRRLEPLGDRADVGVVGWAVGTPSRSAVVCTTMDLSRGGMASRLRAVYSRSLGTAQLAR
ncbi:MAG TPA: hypothetical protein VJ739_13295 [Gemmataceae bacterium]|nr:hypothetical protein [Gemmataceae bacterium]